MKDTTDLIEMARHVLDTNRYMTLGTSEDDGRPRVSPVYFTHHGYRDFYWLSSPDARHSKNIAARPDVSIVIYDSSVAIGQGQAVYMWARAAIVPAAELPERFAVAFADPDPGVRSFQLDDVSGDGAPLRLYLAQARTHEVHIAGRHPVHGTGTDRRLKIDL